MASGGMSVQPGEQVLQVCWQKPDMKGSCMQGCMVSAGEALSAAWQ